MRDEICRLLHIPNDVNRGYTKAKNLFTGCCRPSAVADEVFHVEGAIPFAPVADWLRADPVTIRVGQEDVPGKACLQLKCRSGELSGEIDVLQFFRVAPRGTQKELDVRRRRVFETLDPTAGDFIMKHLFCCFHGEGFGVLFVFVQRS